MVTLVPPKVTSPANFFIDLYQLTHLCRIAEKNYYLLMAAACYTICQTIGYFAFQLIGNITA